MTSLRIVKIKKSTPKRNSTAKKSVRKSRRPVRRRSKSVRRKSRRPLRRRSKSVRKKSSIPQSKPKKSKKYHKSLVNKPKKRSPVIKKSKPSLSRQMSVENPRNLLSITNPQYLSRRSYTPLYLENVPIPPRGYVGLSPYRGSRFTKSTNTPQSNPKNLKQYRKETVTKDVEKRNLHFENLCRRLECYTRINEISLNVIRDYNTENTNIINQEADIKQIFDPEKRIDFIVEKSREYMFDDLFTFMWGKIMSDPIFKQKMGINPNLVIIVFPDMVLDLEYGKELVPQIKQFIKTIKIMDAMSGSDYITPFQLGTPNHIIPGIIRWRAKTIEMYDMNEVVWETVMQDAFRNVMDQENLKDEKNQWTWTWDFSCAPFHSEILKEIRKCSEKYNLTFPVGLCASISIFMVIKNLQAPTKSLSIIYREVSERLVTPGGIKGVLNEMLRYFVLLNEWYENFYCFFLDKKLPGINTEMEKHCLYNKNIENWCLSDADKLERDMLAF